jgi:hypothetical protein
MGRVTGIVVLPQLCKMFVDSYCSSTLRVVLLMNKKEHFKEKVYYIFLKVRQSSEQAMTGGFYFVC